MDFDRSTNFLIGRGTGKTTLINLIKALISADINQLRAITFTSADLRFKDESSNKVARIQVRVVDEPNVLESITYEYRPNSTAKPKEYEVFFRQARRIRLANSKTVRTFLENDHDREFHAQRRLAQVLSGLIEISWLSLHRKDFEVPNDDLDEWDDDRPYISTVDEKLGQVFRDVSRYFFRLDAKVASRLREFQKQSFLSFLTSDSRTDVNIINDIAPEKEKESLTKIFEQFDVNEEQFSEELDAQFRRFSEIRDDLRHGKSTGLKRIAVLVDTLRLHYLVGRWQELEKHQKEILQPKSHFEDVCSDLLFRKNLVVNELNELRIHDDISNNIINIEDLSSGEKQLLIFLSETLLQEKNVHIFLADEPELSLHIEWQESLVAKILELNPNSQVLFATHSPDIVSGFRANVVTMESLIG
ncbi:MAG: AAA family ATPase [Altererythrobacter sp.]